MTITELLNLIRQCNLAQVRAELERLQHPNPSFGSPEDYVVIQRFYENCFRQPK